MSLVIHVLFGLFGFLFIKKWLASPMNFKFLSVMMPFAIPIAIISFLGNFNPVVERALTSKLLSNQELGLYAAGAKLAALLGMVVNAFQTAWGPFYFSIYKNKDASITYNIVLKSFTLFVCFITLILTCFAQPVLVALASEKYYTSSVVVFPLAAGLMVQGICWITEIGIGLSKKSYLNLYGYFFFVLITMLGIFLLTPKLGIFGTSVGVMLGYFFRGVINSCLAQKVFPLPWQFKPVIIIVFITFMIGLLLSYLQLRLTYVHYISIAFLCTSILSIIGVYLLFNQYERKMVILFLYNQLQKLPFIK